MTYLQKAPGRGTYSYQRVADQDIPVIYQEKEQDCAPSCAGLVMKMTNHFLTWKPKELRALSQKAEIGGLAYRPSARDAGAPITRGTTALASVMKASLPNQKNAHLGTGLDNIAAMLRYMGHEKAGVWETDDLKGVMRASSLGSPVIVVANWETGGAHALVVCGYVSKSWYDFFGHGSFIVSDPTYGAGLLQMPREEAGGNKQPSYRPTPTARGHLSSYYVALGS